MTTDNTGPAKLELKNICKVFGQTKAVYNSNLVLHRGEFLSLLGPSGCGKSTTLAMIAGFVDPTSGEILIDGKNITHIPPQKRKIGLVFQDYAIFTKLSVKKNLHFGLEAQKIRRAERDLIVDEFVEKLDISGILNARGGDLNMSEMQRVALARVLVTKAELLLLDEPMSNLDAALRTSLRTELKNIQQELQQTVLYVTHDQTEAMAMSDRIAVMKDGDILQTASPKQIYQKPTSRFVAEFIGDPPINMLRCTISKTGKTLNIATALEQNRAIPNSHILPGPYILGVRPHQFRTSHDPFAGSIGCEVRFVENFGSEHILHVNYADDLLAISVAPGFARESDKLHIRFELEDTHIINPETGEVHHFQNCEEPA